MNTTGNNKSNVFAWSAAFREARNSLRHTEEETKAQRKAEKERRNRETPLAKKAYFNKFVANLQPPKPPIDPGLNNNSQLSSIS